MPCDEDRIWEEKITALLHDPLDKPIMIRGHRRRALDIINLLNLVDHAISYDADVKASSLDRNPLTSSFLARWHEEPEFYHPISGKGKEGDIFSRRELRHALSHGDECFTPDGYIQPNAIRDQIVKLASRCGTGTTEECPITKLLRSKLEDLKERFPGGSEDYRKKQFLFLWRTLDTSLLVGDYSYLIPFLPAETRIPDHDIMDHLVTSSALVPTLEGGGEIALVAVEIGGVEEFISHSRKVRDIWASSYLISLLALLVSRVVSDRLGPDALIFPDLRGNPLMDLYLLAKGILKWDEVLTLWPGGDGSAREFFRKLLVPSLPDSILFFAPKEEVDELRKEIKETVDSFFLQLGKRVLDNLGISNLDDYDKVMGIVKRQLSSLPHPLSLRMEHVVLRAPSRTELREKNLEKRVKQVLNEELSNIVPSRLTEWKTDQGSKVSLLGELATMIGLFDIALLEGLSGHEVGDTTLYPAFFLLLQAKMRRAKMIQEYSYLPEPGEEYGAKVSKRCMLCGARNPLITGEVDWVNEGWRNLLSWMEKEEKAERWLFSENEPLCSVGMIKRLLLRDENLVSAWSLALRLDPNELVITLNEGARISSGKGDVRGRESRIGEESLSEEARKLLRDAMGRIPTIDDVAAAPIRPLLEDKELDEKILRAMASALVEVVDCRSKVGVSNTGGELHFIEEVISELGVKFSKVIRELMRNDKSGDRVSKVADMLKSSTEIPGALLFPSIWKNVRDEMAKKGGRECQAKAVEKLIEILKDELEGLSNYVTVIKLDGDRIGRWISGMMFVEKDVRLMDRLYCIEKSDGELVFRENCDKPGSDKSKSTYLDEFLRDKQDHLTKLHRMMTPSLHRNISSILRDLSLIYPDIVDELGGVTLYSAGDELLAIVPASKTIDLVERIVGTYRSEIFSSRGRIRMGMGRLATMSGGAAISHRYVPLGEMLEAVREEMRTAKDGSEDSPPGSRNRISFTKMSRGGKAPRAVIDGDLILDGRISGLFSKVLSYMTDRPRVGTVTLSKDFSKEFLEYMERYASKLYDPENPEELEPLVRLVIRRNLHGGERDERSGVEGELTRLYMELLKAGNLSKKVHEWHIGFIGDKGLESVDLTLERTWMVHAHRLLDMLLREVLTDGSGD